MNTAEKQKSHGFAGIYRRAQIFILFLSVVLLIPVSGFSGSQEAGPPEPAEVKQSDTPEQSTILVYYFHSTKRCTSCKKIESWSYNAIHQNFAEDLKTGNMIWKLVNTDKPENKHFVSDFQLYTKSLVLVEMKDKEQKRWKNLKKVWQLLNNEQSFHEYVKQETDSFMKGM